jgi:hypothetical protein
MSTNINSLLQPHYVKPIISAVVATIMDRLILKQEDMTSNVTFGIAVGLGTFGGQMIGVKVSDALLPTDQIIYNFSGKTLLQRAIEIGSAGGSSYVFNRYLFANDFNQSALPRKLAVIVSSEVISEYISDILQGNPVAYLNP